MTVLEVLKGARAKIAQGRARNAMDAIYCACEHMSDEEYDAHVNARLRAMALCADVRRTGEPGVAELDRVIAAEEAKS